MKKSHLTFIYLCLISFVSAIPILGSENLRFEARATGQALVLEMDGKTHVLSETGNLISNETIRTSPGSSAVAVTWTETPAKEGAVSYYAISLDRKAVQTVRAANYNLMMRNNHFDPLSRVPEVASELMAPADSNLYIVQFWTQGLERYRSQIKELGGEFHRYLPMYAELVEMDADTHARVSQLPFVRWTGPYHVSYKLDEAVKNAGESRSDRAIRYNILSMRRGSVGQSPVLESIWNMGGTVHDVSPETYLFNASLTTSQMMEVARMDGVQWIDLWSAPEDDMDIAREFHGADYVQGVAGYTGQGVRVEVMDGGCDENHPDLQNYVIHNNNTPSAHGTATSGIVLGSGANNAAATGVMPDAFLSIADYNYVSGGSRYNHTAELQDPADVYRSVLQSNSWGDARTTVYSSISQDMDLILFDHDRISILQSQSNAGNQQSRPQAWSKNIISVGGVRHYGTLTKSDDAWAGGASIGPAQDGRIKPDLASFYDSTLCTDQVGSAGYASGNYYSSFGGTSGATPIVAGHLGLIYQMWSNGDFGNATPGTTVFENRPYNTTAKALLINTSTQWTFSGTGHDLTRVNQGWGHPDLVKAYDQRNNLYIVDESDVLTNLASTVHSVAVAAGTAEFKATMVYRDLPGTTSSSLHRINDMDLKVTSPSGDVYWGNNGLLANMYSTTGGSANTLDTVENVFVQNPQAGTWQVEVIASELNGDSHVETPGVDADYALVVSGVDTGAPTCNYAISPTSANYTEAGGSGSVSVTADPGCDWIASSNDAWITITSGSSGTGNGSVAYSVAVNGTSSSRTGTMTIAGKTYTVTQDGAPSCGYAISPASANYAAAGGSGSVSVTAGAGCSWTAVSNDSWITVTSGASGTGNGSTAYSVAQNSSTSSRTGTLTIAGETHTVTQAGNCLASGSSCSSNSECCSGSCTGWFTTTCN